MKTRLLARSRALARPKSFSTTARANSMEDPGPWLVIRLPSTRTLFWDSLGSERELHMAGYDVAFFACHY